MKIALTGATGFIGQHLTQILLESGHEVYALTRKKSNLQILEKFQQSNFSIYQVDFQNLSTLNDFFSVHSVDILIHCAGVIKGFSYKDYHEGNVIPTENLLTSISSLKNPPFFIYLSSASACGPSTDLENLKDENSALSPVSLYGLSKKNAESLFDTYQSKIKYSIIRPGGVYGPGEKLLLPVFKMAKHGLFIYLANKRSTIDLIYVKDLAQLITEIALKKPKNRLYIATDNHHPNQQETCYHIFKLLKSSKKFKINITIPSILVTFAGCLSTLFTRSLKMKVPFFNQDKAREAIQKYWSFKADKVHQEFNCINTSLEKGLKELYEWYKKENLL